MGSIGGRCASMIGRPTAHSSRYWPSERVLSTCLAAPATRPVLLPTPWAFGRRASERGGLEEWLCMESMNTFFDCAPMFIGMTYVFTMCLHGFTSYLICVK